MGYRPFTTVSAFRRQQNGQNGEERRKSSRITAPGRSKSNIKLNEFMDVQVEDFGTSGTFLALQVPSYGIMTDQTLKQPYPRTNHHTSIAPAGDEF